MDIKVKDYLALKNMENKNILIIHGWGASSKSWKIIKEILENKNFKVFSPDLPGFGLEPPPKEVWGTKEYSLWVKDFIKDNIGKKKFILIGHSFGGAIAVNLVNLLPEQVEKVILVSPAILRTNKKLANQIKKTIKFIKKAIPLKAPEVSQKLVAKLLKNTDYYKSQGILKEIFKKVIEEKFPKEFKLIDKPLLLIWGTRDRLVPLKEGHILKDIAKERAKLVVYKNIGHSPNLQVPERLAKDILNFI